MLRSPNTRGTRSWLDSRRLGFETEATTRGRPCRLASALNPCSARPTRRALGGFPRCFGAVFGVERVENGGETQVLLDPGFYQSSLKPLLAPGA